MFNLKIFEKLRTASLNLNSAGFYTKSVDKLQYKQNLPVSQLVINVNYVHYCHSASDLKFEEDVFSEEDVQL